MPAAAIWAYYGMVPKSWSCSLVCLDRKVDGISWVEEAGEGGLRKPLTLMSQWICLEDILYGIENCFEKLTEMVL